MGCRPAASAPRQEGSEWAEVEVEILRPDSVLLAEFCHPLVEQHQSGSDLVSLRIAEIALIDTANCLPLHQLPEEFDHREHEGDEVMSHLVGVKIKSRSGHNGPPSAQGAGTRSLTDDSRA